MSRCIQKGLEILKYIYIYIYITICLTVCLSVCLCVFAAYKATCSPQSSCDVLEMNKRMHIVAVTIAMIKVTQNNQI